MAAAATTSTDLNLREGPGTDFAVILVMPAGAVVNIVEDQASGFYRVQFGDTTGWASADFIDRSGGGDLSTTATATVSSALNLRAGPSTGDEILAVMPAGASVTITGESADGFLAVVFSGTSGWAASRARSASP
jgi:uncharacterized protein YraI